MLEFLALAQACAPTVAPQTMAAVVNVESSHNPYAIGVVGGRLARQPTNRNEAVATAKQLVSDGWNFSVGIAQVNRYNLPKYKINYEEAFDACTNLRVGSKILEDCYVRASKRTPDSQAALHAAFSCYYSGNFSRGFKPDIAGKPSYVQKVLASAGTPQKAILVVPSIHTGVGPKPQFDKAARSQASTTLNEQTTKPPSHASDNAPIVLHPSNSGRATADRLQPFVASQADYQLNEKTAPRSSVIVF